MNTDATFGLLLNQALQVTIVGLIAWVIVLMFAKDRPHLAHAIWALVLLKCVTPPVWNSPTSPFRWRANEVSTVTTSETTGPGLPSFLSASRKSVDHQSTSATLPIPIESFPISKSKNTASPDSRLSNLVSLPISAQPRVQWKRWVVVGWLIGTGTFVLIAMARWVSLRCLLWRKTVPTSNRLNELALSLANRLGLSSRVRVRVLDSPIGPAVTGCFRPVILLPRFEVGLGTELNSTGRTEALMAHELIHYRRGDVWMTLLQTLAKSVLWFHPVVWLASIRLDREAERSCDEETVACLNCSPASYARMLIEILEAKHRLHVIPALPGVRPVEVTAKRLERIMRFGNGIHHRRPRWIIVVFGVAALFVLPGSANVVGLESRTGEKPVEPKAAGANTQIKTDSNAEEPNATGSNTNDWNYAKQVCVEANLYRLTQSQIDDLELEWIDEEGQPDRCILNENATKRLTKKLSKIPDLFASAPRVTVFDGSDWHIEKLDKRTLVTGWKPFVGQENQPVRTLSPITEDFSQGHRIEMKVKCKDDSNEVDLSVDMMQTSIESVATSMFTYEHDIGGEPHPIQTPKMDKQGVVTQARIPVKGALVLRGLGRSNFTVIRCITVMDTPEVAEHVAEARRKGYPLPGDMVSNDREKWHREDQPASRKKDPVSKVYVDCGIDFTQSQIDKIAGRHSKYGFESIQVRNGRLRVLAQDLAHAEGARLQFGISPDNSPKATPLVRGGEKLESDPFDYSVLQGAMEAHDVPCRLEGHIDYTIDRESIELRASPMELVYGDDGTRYRLRADQGEIRLLWSSGGIEMSFVGKVEIALGDWRATAHSYAMTDSRHTLSGDVSIEQIDEQGTPTQRTKLGSDEFFFDLRELNSIEEIIAAAELQE